ncbi:hypothetical protein Bp8pC_006 [Bacillus phage Bp8p-C]|uniref:Uncharacterized protein n=2 Tax=Agatevirus Bp8pC TaxID=1910937 RepID=A0A0A0PLC8_9CAUD|nr:hypothetical protein AXJ20_gp006 [Bacillus phage Bp8p-C]YP_009784307.1 hypothetical protein QLX39_gp006 [Bacillus phage Bp8p-T]AHJ87437.1 hypothetical protein Bp8pC_006 [Bacillus phage Bp8p-C]AHJ87648.1 hypothetical protein Bp8pT_006 [Bacillus phage Bp8p-T]
MVSMMEDIELHPMVSKLHFREVGSALYAATSSFRAVYETSFPVAMHLYNWLSGFIETGHYDYSKHGCPAKAHTDKAGGGCSICFTINNHLNLFPLVSCGNPLTQLETLMQTISNRAILVSRYTDVGSDLEEIGSAAHSYLSAAADKINNLAVAADRNKRLEIESELLKMKMDGDILYDSNEMESLIYSDEEFESSPLDTLNPLIEGETDQEIEETSNKQEVPYQNYTTDEWENVTPVKQPRAYEMTKMDTDTLLDLYNYYTQLNSFFKDGSFDKKIGIIKAVLSDRTKKVVKF